MCMHEQPLDLIICKGKKIHKLDEFEEKFLNTIFSAFKFVLNKDSRLFIKLNKRQRNVWEHYCMMM